MFRNQHSLDDHLRQENYKRGQRIITRATNHRHSWKNHASEGTVFVTYSVGAKNIIIVFHEPVYETAILDKHGIDIL